MASLLEKPAPSVYGSRYNFAAFLADMVSYFGGAALLSTSTILPLFVSHLVPGTRDRALAMALIPMLGALGMTLPQIIGARLVAHRERYRPFLVRWIIVERVAVLGCVVSMALLAKAPPLALLVAPMAFLLVWWGAMGINNPAYSALLEQSIPPKRRGRLFGFGAAMGGVVGFGFAWVARYFLRTLEFPYGFVACAGMAFVLLTVGVAPLCFVREAPRPRPRAQRPERARTLAVLRANPPFRNFVVSQALFAFHTMPAAIWTDYALRRFRAGDADIATLAAVMALAGGVGFVASGWMADRYGNRAVLLVSTVLTALAALCAWAAPTLPLYIATFVPAMLASSGWQLTNFNIVLEFAPPGQVPAYSAVNSLVAGSFRVAAPLAGGLLAREAGGHATVFLVAAASALASAAVLRHVTEPRQAAGV